MTDKLETILKDAELVHLLPNLVDQGVVDSMLPNLSESDLKSLGIDKLGERKRLLSALTANRSPDKPQSAPEKSFKDEEKKSSQKKSDAVQDEQPAANPTAQQKIQTQPAANQPLTKPETTVAPAKSEPPAAKPANRVWVVIGIFVMGPLALFFVSWKRALLSIFLLFIALGLPIVPALKFWLFWVVIPLILVFTKKRS